MSSKATQIATQKSIPRKTSVKVSKKLGQQCLERFNVTKVATDFFLFIRVKRNKEKVKNVGWGLGSIHRLLKRKKNTHKQSMLKII